MLLLQYYKYCSRIGINIYIYTNNRYVIAVYYVFHFKQCGILLLSAQFQSAVYSYTSS